MNIRQTVNNSNLPININKDKIHFPTLGISLKELQGPTLPIPGPTFPTAEATALIEVIISIPNPARKIEPIAKTNRYKKINARRL